METSKDIREKEAINYLKNMDDESVIINQDEDKFFKQQIELPMHKEREKIPKLELQTPPPTLPSPQKKRSSRKKISKAVSMGT